MAKSKDKPTTSLYLSRQRKQPGRLKQWAFSHQPDDTWLTAMLRSGLQILFIMIQEFVSTNISLRASALTFSIILSMVPLLAMSTAILKGLGSGEELRIVAYRFIDQLDPHLDPTELTANDSAPTSPDTVDTPDEIAVTALLDNDSVDNDGADNDTGEATPPPSLNKHLHNAVDTIFNYVENTNFAALGAFGIAGLLVVVIMVMSSVENAMNAIWHTRRGRSLFRKIMDYLALLILLPISINVAIAGDAILHSPKIMGYIATVVPSVWVVQMLLKLLPFGFITLSLMMMYLFFPHVRVKTYAALSGALFGAFFWFIVQRAYVVLQIGVANYNAIYGSFATVLLFLIWMQLGWTFILLGAVLAYAIQNREQYQLPGTVTKAQQELQCAFDVLIAVYNNFALARATSSEQLLDSYPDVNDAELTQAVDLLIRGGLLHTVEENGLSGLIPSRPAEKLGAAEVVRLVLGHDQNVKTVGGTLADQVIQAAEKIIAPADFPGSFPDTEERISCDATSAPAERPAS